MSRLAATFISAALLVCVGIVPGHAETAPDQPDETRSWYIDPHDTTIRFTAMEFKVKQVRGSFNTALGTIQYDGKSPQSLKVHAEIDVDTIDTNIRMRDNALKSDDFFKVSRYPMMIFDSTRIIPVSPGFFRMYGNLKIRMAEKEVVLEVHGPSAFGKTARGVACFTARATTTLNRKDFGITHGGLMISDQIPVTIQVRAIEGIDPEAGMRADAKQQAAKDQQNQEAFKKMKQQH